LAFKAALKLHKKQAEGKLIPQLKDALAILGNDQHKKLAYECADRAITLVKNKENILPILPETYKKVLFYGIEAAEGFAYSVKVGVIENFINILKSKGFEVDRFEAKPGKEGMVRSTKEVTDNYDLIIYVANLATKSNQTSVRIEWEHPWAPTCPYS
jgi:beta-N-acetylhexosaminidase